MAIALLPRLDFPGWRLLGAFPDGDPDDVGSWLLTSGGEALLLEIPPGLTRQKVQQALHRSRSALRYATASHEHEDHLDANLWTELAHGFPTADFLHPSTVEGDRLLHLGGEPLWLIRAPKHSHTDVVAVFRGVAMTGDIELGTLASVNDEVPEPLKRESLRRLAGFEARTGYRVHTTVSAHLNDLRQCVRWPDLFSL